MGIKVHAGISGKTTAVRRQDCAYVTGGFFLSPVMVRKVNVSLAELKEFNEVVVKFQSNYCTIKKAVANFEYVMAAYPS